MSCRDEDKGALLEHIAALETMVRHFEKERRLWQAIAWSGERFSRTLEMDEDPSTTSPDYESWMEAFQAARVAGLTWEEEKQ